MNTKVARLYECGVWHQRQIPLRKAFRYRVFMMAFELGEMPSLAQRIPWLSWNRWNLFSVNDKDHIDLGEAGGIRPNLQKWLREQEHHVPADAHIELVTFPRVLGYGFNPVSFYYLSSRDGEPLGVVAEVVNTFREMKLYFLSEMNGEEVYSRRVAKNFYVSPFSDPGDDFDFRLGCPAESWQVNIDNWTGGEKSLTSAISGQERSLTASRLLWYALKYPFLSLQIIFGIHWQAFLLWTAKVSFFRKSDRAEAQCDVLRPYSSSKIK